MSHYTVKKLVICDIAQKEFFCLISQESKTS